MARAKQRKDAPVWLPFFLYHYYLRINSVNIIAYCQMNVFLNRLNGEPIGVSILGIFVIDKNTILAVRKHMVHSLFFAVSSSYYNPT